MHKLVEFVHSVLFYASFQYACVSLMNFLLIMKNIAKSARKPAATEVESFTPLPLRTFIIWCRLAVLGRVESSKIQCAIKLLADPVPTDDTYCGLTNTIDLYFFLPYFKRIYPTDKSKHCQN